jgi:hypothetical protein
VSSRTLETVAARLADLSPGLSSAYWQRSAWEAVQDKVPKGEDPEPAMTEHLHQKCLVAHERTQGLRQLQEGLKSFRSKTLVPEDVRRANLARLRRAGGLTDSHRKEMGLKSPAEQREEEIRRAHKRQGETDHSLQSNTAPEQEVEP